MIEAGQTFAPLWRVECQHPRCGWFAESVMRSTLEDEWEAHDETAHADAPPDAGRKGR